MALSMHSAAMFYGPKKHLKHVAAQKHWTLDKLTSMLLLVQLPVPTN